MVRMSTDQTARDYVEKRQSEGKTKVEAMRCLKRYIAREVYNALPKNSPRLTVGASLPASCRPGGA